MSTEDCAPLGYGRRAGSARRSRGPAGPREPISRRIPDTAQAINLYPDCFTSAFLRNPYERFVSLWHHLRRVARANPGPLSFVGSAGSLDEEFARGSGLPDLLAAPIPRHRSCRTGAGAARTRRITTARCGAWWTASAHRASRLPGAALTTDAARWRSCALTF